MDPRRRKRTFRVPRINILGIEVDDVSQKDAVFSILKMAKDEKGGKHVVTINSEFVILAKNSEKFRDVLAGADLSVPDGQGVVWAKLILGGREHERVTGVDLVEKLCGQSAEKAISVGFLGGFGGVAETVSKRQKELNPGLKVVFAGPGDPAIGYDSKLKKELSGVGRVDILFVAYGMGQQEFWIERNRNRLDVGVLIGVGGAFDYLSMVKKRAPRPLHNIGLEWLWRLVMEPARIWRMRVLPVFVVLVIGQFFAKKLNLSPKKIF